MRTVLLIAAVAVGACPGRYEEPPLASLRHHARINVSHPEVQKRYETITGQDPQAQLWSRTNIVYCYDDATDARNIIQPYMAESWNLWNMAGLTQGTLLDPTAFGFAEGSPAWCGNPQRQSLLIKANTNLEAVTTPGWRPASGNLARSTMTFDPNMGKGDRQATIAILAHEIGHAWGLLHEHQRPSAWSSEVLGGTASTLGAQVTFNCQNLAVYDSLVAAGSNPDHFCTSRTLALLAGASSSQFLPFEAPLRGGVMTNKEGGIFDWSSIMLYNSRTGSLQGGGNTLVTALLKLPIAGNLVPSPYDVNALESLYSVTAVRPPPCFFWQPCSPFNAVFRGLLPRLCNILS